MTDPDPDTRPNGQRKGDSGLLRAMNNIGSSIAIVAASGGLGGATAFAYTPPAGFNGWSN